MPIILNEYIIVILRKGSSKSQQLNMVLDISLKFSKNPVTMYRPLTKETVSKSLHLKSMHQESSFGGEKVTTTSAYVQSGLELASEEEIQRCRVKRGSSWRSRTAKRSKDNRSAPWCSCPSSCTLPCIFLLQVWLELITVSSFDSMNSLGGFSIKIAD